MDQAELRTTGRRWIQALEDQGMGAMYCGKAAEEEAIAYGLTHDMMAKQKGASGHTVFANHTSEWCVFVGYSWGQAVEDENGWGVFLIKRKIAAEMTEAQLQEIFDSLIAIWGMPPMSRLEVLRFRDAKWKMRKGKR